MSLESSNENTEQSSRNRNPEIAKRLIVATVALVALTIGVLAATSGKRLFEASTGCTTTLSESNVRVTFKGPHASSNCSEWVADFNGQHEGWMKRLDGKPNGTSLICTLSRDKDTARVRDTGFGLIGSLACLSLETDGWKDTTPLDN